jgi:hypothetical protein
MRADGTWDRLEQILNDPRSGSAAEREMLARRVAAHKIGQDAVNYQPQTEAEAKAAMAAAREKMATFVNMDDEDADNDLAVYEKAAKITLGDKVEKPVEVPSWSKPVQVITDDGDRLDFYNRQAKTPSTKEWHEHHDGSGNPRNARTGKIEKAGDFKPLDHEPPKRDDDRGFSVDRERGVMSEAEHRELDNFEQSQNAPEPTTPTPEPAAPEQPVNF